MMKKLYVLVCFTIFGISVNAQSYDVLNYDFNGTPVHGINIKTNLPFVNSSQMVSLKIEGYNFGLAQPISLNLVWYIYDNAFLYPAISSGGAYIPEIFLTNNNGFVNIYINDKPYYQRFKITAFAQGMAEQSSWFQGWTTADEAIQGGHVVAVPYKNSFSGTVTNNGNLYSLGNVGIGTTDTKGYKLAVAGNMIAESVKVKLQSAWPDYVFAPSYKLPTLQETEKHIREKGHLPGIPSASEVKTNGVDLGEMNAKLLQKIEELTLHLIEKDKQLLEQKLINSDQEDRLRKLEMTINKK